jgi:transposase
MKLIKLGWLTLICPGGCGRSTVAIVERKTRCHSIALPKRATKAVSQETVKPAPHKPRSLKNLRKKILKKTDLNSPKQEKMSQFNVQILQELKRRYTLKVCISALETLLKKIGFSFKMLKATPFYLNEEGGIYERKYYSNSDSLPRIANSLLTDVIQEILFNKERI